MAGSVSKTILIGNVGKDAVIRNGGAGKGIASFSVATSESWRDKTSGERKERTEWHNIVVFSEQLVKFAEHHVRKGMKVYIEGQNQTRKWTDKAGVERYSTEVVLNGFNARLDALESLGTGGPPPAHSPDDYGRESSRPQANRPSAGFDDSTDIPF